MSSVDFLQEPGQVIDPSRLTIPRARDTVKAVCAEGAYARLIECRSRDGGETIVIELDIERPQNSVHDIRELERVAIRYSVADDHCPLVLALRKDFPRALPHLLLHTEDLPPSLCLYERSWDDLKITWTAAGFVERIRWWFARTAHGDLHAPDQPLEPIMSTHGFRLVVPADFGSSRSSLQTSGRFTVRDGRTIVTDDNAGKGRECLILYLKTPVKCHGVIHRAPSTLCDLATLLNEPDFNLLGELRNRLQNLSQDEKQRSGESHWPVLVLSLPKKRNPEDSTESVEHFGIICKASVACVGETVGAWRFVDGHFAHLLCEEVRADRTAEIEIAVAGVVWHLNRARASIFSGQWTLESQKVTAIGLGALGSQVTMNLARAGFGDWTLIDDDVLLPHNLVRHASIGAFSIGYSKVVNVAYSMGSLTKDGPRPKAIEANFLRLGERKSEVDTAVEDADFILDMSASIAVSRRLSGIVKRKRALSLFISPKGDDLVLLAEDLERRCSLDDLEMAYYAAIANRQDLKGHLEKPEGSSRWGNGCRDLSFQIPQHRVGTWAGIGSEAVLRKCETPDAAISIWRFDSETASVEHISVPVPSFLAQEFCGWTVKIDHCLIKRVSELRRERLPNETGGILLGGIDYDKKNIYVLLALPSPTDSRERPTLYIRGTTGLESERSRIVDETAGNLDYLGEWHSHPKGSSTLPSPDDREVFGWIRKHTGPDGKPPVMMIVGDRGARVIVDEVAEPCSEELCL